MQLHKEVGNIRARVLWLYTWDQSEWTIILGETWLSPKLSYKLSDSKCSCSVSVFVYKIHPTVYIPLTSQGKCASRKVDGKPSDLTMKSAWIQQTADLTFCCIHLCQCQGSGLLAWSVMVSIIRFNHDSFWYIVCLFNDLQTLFSLSYSYWSSLESNLEVSYMSDDALRINEFAVLFQMGKNRQQGRWLSFPYVDDLLLSWMLSFHDFMVFL